jgi:hypothetical protein
MQDRDGIFTVGKSIVNWKLLTFGVSRLNFRVLLPQAVLDAWFYKTMWLVF